MDENANTPVPGNAETPAPATVQPPQPPNEPANNQHHKKLLTIVAVAVVLVAAIGIDWWFGFRTTQPVASTSSSSTTALKPQASSNAQTAQGLQLDASKNYGNKYAGGTLPVGDGKYVTTGPKQGYVYACTQYAQNLATDNGGASTRGPWFSSDGKTWNVNKKVSVQGSVGWKGSFSNTVSGGTRTIVTNELPLNHTTGVFPISSSDPAYSYDRNPNSIKAQSYTFSLPASPSYGTSPNCIGGTVGIMLTGVEIFSAFDAGGRDAGAWEVQDGCQGHPQEQGVYHYHTLSSCIKDTSVHTVIGFALDGFPITGPKLGANNVLTTSDLDECHGITSQINLDGKSVTMYHYVMTQDFPYSVSCYRGTAIQPPGLGGQQQAQQQGQIPNRQPRPQP